MSKLKTLLSAFLAASFLSLTTQSIAATTTGGMLVTANVLASCNMIVNNLSFGNVTPASSGYAVASSTINSTCTVGTPYTISFSSGITGTYSDRLMSNAQGTRFISYNIYKDNTYSSILGDGTGTTSTITAVGNGLSQTSNIYGRMNLTQYPPAAFYLDSVTVTLTY